MQNISSKNAQNIAAPYYIIAAYNKMGAVKPKCWALKKNGYRSLVLLNKESTADYTDCADLVLRSEDIFNPKLLAKELAPYVDEIQGFLSCQDRVWASVFQCSQILKKPYPDYKGQVQSRLKALMRLKTQSLSSLSFEFLEKDHFSEERLHQIAESLSYPFVVKPIWGVGSDGVKVIHSPEEAHYKIPQLFQFLSTKEEYKNSFFFEGIEWDPKKLLLCEEFIEGTEYALEGYVKEGVFFPLITGEKSDCSFVGDLPVEDSNIYPAISICKEEADEIHKQLAESLKNIEVQNSFVHIEFRFHEGKMEVIEVNPRNGGWGIPYTIEVLGGPDIRKWAIKHALGQEIPETLNLDENRRTFISLHSTTHYGRVKEVEGLDWAKAQPEYLSDLSFVGPEDEVKRSDGEFYYSMIFFDWTQPERMREIYEDSREKVQIHFHENATFVNKIPEIYRN